MTTSSNSDVNLNLNVLFDEKFINHNTITNNEHYLMTLADIQSLQLLASLSKNSHPSWRDFKAAKHFKNP